jgi:1,4-alpha-glucan branching enzyme
VTAVTPDILSRKETSFVLWCPPGPATPGDAAPALVIGRLELGAPVRLVDERRFGLEPVAGFPDLWAIPAARCELIDGQVYHYWFEVTDAHPGRPGQRIRVTDPTATLVDWRVSAPRPPGPGYGDDDSYPAAVVLFRHGRLQACDAGGETGEPPPAPPLAALPPNNRLVVYELPTGWTHTGSAGEREIGLGTFRDALALVDPAEAGGNFSDLEIAQPGRSYLTELGVNALELLPPADSFYVRQWGYGTTNFAAPDFELGFPASYAWPAPNRDLRALVAACHARGIRFLVDAVMAFARTNAYLAAATDAFFILDPGGSPGDPDARSSRGEVRNGFGSTLFRYAAFADGYDPVGGQAARRSPARQLMKASLLRWMHDFRIDGLRLDSVENVASWDFVQEYTELARGTWRGRFPGQDGEADARFIVVGEELTEPLDLLRQRRLDGLWHERFKKYVRAAILGQAAEGEATFEETVRKAIDCRRSGYDDGAQAVIYLTSHDVEGFRNERLFDFLRNNGVADAERRIKLAFACLLTAVGIPMILAGEEFADQHDLFDAGGHVTQGGGKQVDPVNFSRAGEEWRRRVRQYAARLIALRTTSDALAVNDTEFIHADVDDGKRVLAWRRGGAGDRPVVVVANFSGFGTADAASPHAEYRVHNWPATAPGQRWREITQARDVPPEWVGREPIFPWEAKVYTLA